MLKRTSESPKTEELAFPSSDDGSSCSLPPLRRLLLQHAAGGSRARMDATAIAAATEKKRRMQTRPRTQSVVSLHSSMTSVEGESRAQPISTLYEEAKPSPAKPNPANERRSPPRTRLRRERPVLPHGHPAPRGSFPIYSASAQHGCSRARVPEQGRGVMGHNLVDAEDQNAKSRVGLCMSLGVVGTSGGVELKHQWRYKKGRWSTLRHKIVLYLSI